MPSASSMVNQKFLVVRFSEKADLVRYFEVSECRVVVFFRRRARTLNMLVGVASESFVFLISLVVLGISCFFFFCWFKKKVNCSLHPQPCPSSSAQRKVQHKQKHHHIQDFPKYKSHFSFSCLLSLSLSPSLSLSLSLSLFFFFF